MAFDWIVTPYGADARDALAAAVADAKAGDPLAPVTVVVPSNYAGLAARRGLARRSGGMTAVSFLTVYGLAEQLGARPAAASGRRPVSTPVVAAAVRSVLRTRPGYFAGVETHPATERALVRAHRELSDVSSPGLNRLAATSSRAADVIRIHRATRAALADRFYDEQQLMTAAVGVIAADGRTIGVELGRVIVFLPQRLTDGQARLLRAAAEHSTLTVIAGTTGVADADAAVQASLRRLAPAIRAEAPAGPGEHVTRPDRILSVSDADDEVRHAVRAVMQAARTGSRLGRCAILYGSSDPYARLVGDALDSAGIQWCGATVPTAETSLLGRSLLAMLALTDNDMSRRDVTAWLAAAPIRYDPNRPSNPNQPSGPSGESDPSRPRPRRSQPRLKRRPVPAATWERVARAAAVVAGADQWAQRLGRYADELEAEADEIEAEADEIEASRDHDGEEQPGRAEHRRQSAERTRELAAFVARLHADLDRGSEARSWRKLSRWCTGLIGDYLGTETDRGHWPDDEQDHARTVGATVERLGELDGIDPEPSVVAFRQALRLELADHPGRHGRFGAGVLVGPVGLALGVELDLVVVCGMAEGVFPAHRHDDVLLPDRERIAVGSDLALRTAPGDDHRALLEVLAAAEQSLLSYPRGDLRRSAQHVRSRWLPARTGSGTIEIETEVPSFVTGLRQTTFPAHVQEYDMRALLGLHDRHQPHPHQHDKAESILAHPSVCRRVELRRGIELRLARASNRFTRFDGNLARDANLRSAALPDPTAADTIVSATGLEAWAECPHAYFVSQVLGVNPVENPETEYRISSLTRGHLVHHSLKSWLTEALEESAVPAPAEPWPEPRRRRLGEIAEQECDRLEARGQTGRTLYWNRDRRRLLADLDAFVDFDDEMRARHRSVPMAAELGFGQPDSSHGEVTIELDRGLTIRFRGSIDRVDTTDGGGFVVIDYKTGSSRRYKQLSPDNPSPNGRHLQLGLYSAALRRSLEDIDAPVWADYWFVSAKEGFKSLGYDVTEPVQARVLQTVGAMIDGITGGLYPLHPEPPNWRPWIPCRFCDPDGLGTRDQWHDWQRKTSDTDLHRYLAVAEPELLESITSPPQP